MHKAKILFLFLILNLSIIPCFSQTKGSIPETKTANNMKADYMDRDYDKGVIYLKGKVGFDFAQKKLSADNAEIWYKSKLVIATGNAVISSGSFAMQGERIEYDYGNDVGTIFNGAVKSGKVTFKGEKLEKKGPTDFSADYGTYTACDCDPPTWSFTGHNIDAGVGSYAYVKWPILRAGNIPIFALPYIIVPLKSSRQTGLLLPTYEKTSEGGSTFGQSFFWAISPSQDSTITLKKYDLRGLKSILEYRQRYSSTSFLELNGAFLNDKAVYEISRYKAKYGSSEKSYDRWYFKTNQFLELPENFTQRLYLNFTSDLQYLGDFYQEISTGETALENHYSLTKKRDDLLLLFDSTMYTNLLKSDPLADNSDSVHRLPEVRLAVLERPIGSSGFSYKIDANYVNFARNTQAWDDVTTDQGTIAAPLKKKPTPDGVFNSEDLIRTGQRIDFQPSISYTYRTRYGLDFVPSLLYRETYYQFPVSAPDFEPTVSRRYLQTNISARLKAFRVYDQETSKLKHEIVPEIAWTNTPFINQPSHRFFGASAIAANFRQSQAITDDDFYNQNKLQFDYNDRIYDRSLVTFMVNNKLIRKRIFENLNDYRQIGTIRIWQTYDLIESNRIRTDGSINKPWSEISTLFDFRLDNFETNSLFQYFPYHNITNSSVRFKFFNSMGNFFEITYTQKFNLKDNTLDIDYKSRTENVSPRVGLVTKYFDVAGGPDYNFVTHEIPSWVADVALKPPGNCIRLGLQFVKPTNGNLSFTARFNMSFDGS